MRTFESPRQRARRLRCTLTAIYAQLAADRIPGAYKCDNRWYLPVEPTVETSQPLPVDWKMAQAADHDV